MLRYFFPLIAVLLLLQGCESASVTALTGYTDDWQALPDRSGPGLVGNPMSPIPDVLVPIGFKPLPLKCSSSFDGSFRQVSHVYQGKADTAELIHFFMQYLPNTNWKLFSKADDLATNSYVMNFKKGVESLRIRIFKQINIATIVIEIHPRNTAIASAPQPLAISEISAPTPANP